VLSSHLLATQLLGQLQQVLFYEDLEGLHEAAVGIRFGSDLGQCLEKLFEIHPASRVVASFL
jgi:hypothetical protein